MSRISIESEEAIAELQRLKSKMICDRKRIALYGDPWSITKQEKIDKVEVDFYTRRLEILRALPKSKQMTVLRALQRKPYLTPLEF